MEVSLVILLYAYCYCMTASLVRRWFFRRASSVHTALFAILLIPIGSLVPVLVAYLTRAGRFMRSRQADLWMLGNPAAALAEGPVYARKCLVFTLVWAGIVTALSLPWLLRQVESFKPIRNQQPQQEAPPADA